MGLRRTPQSRPDAGKKLVDAKRLCHIIVGTGVEGLDLGPLFATNREHDYRQRRELADLVAKLDAVHFGHLEIGNYQIGMPVAKRVERRQTVRRGAHVITMGRQAVTQDARDLWFVIDYENFLRFAHSSPIGRVSTTFVPSLFSPDLISIRPF